MYLTPFTMLFPEQAGRETRVIFARDHATLPDDEYGLLESYCTDPRCDCRRVMLNVVARYQHKWMAAISYGFDRQDEMAGPFLDPLNEQSQYAPTLFLLVQEILKDPAYVARLERHYAQVKQAAADPQHAIQPLLAQLERERAVLDGRPPPPKPRGRPKRKRR